MTSHRKPSRFLLTVAIAILPLQALGDVTFSGLETDLEQNARALMALASAPCDAAEWRIERLYRNADEELRSALEALGYYRYALDKRLTLDGGKCWNAHFDVTLDEPVRIREVSATIDGAAESDASVKNVLSQHPQPGEILDHGRYEGWKRTIRTTLSNRGYFDAELVESRVTVDAGLQHADIVLRVESGPRYYFGDVQFVDPVLRPELLAGYVRFRKGDPYDAREIARLHERLSGSGYFASVSIRAEPVAELGLEIPVRVNLSPGKRRVYTGGVGYATDTGAQARLGYTNRRRNDRGHQFDARLFLSDVDSELTGTYRWPRGRPDAEWVDIYGGFLRKRTDTSQSDKSTLGLRISRNRTETWLESPYIDFSREEFLVGEQLDISTLVMPGIRWETNVGRDLKRVPSGRRISFDLRGAHNNLFSDTTFAQATASAKWITTLGSATRLLTRIDLGATAKRELEELPPTVRFFAGGDTSVRGYAYESIGPTDSSGNVIGGSNLATISLEADWMVFGNWAVAAFVDSGSAFNDVAIDMKTGAGLGIRWFSPLGPIRFDVAHPFNDVDANFRFHITLGPDL